MLKYEVRSVILLRRCDNTDFLAIVYKMEASTKIKYFELEKSQPYIPNYYCRKQFGSEAYTDMF